MFSRTSCSDMAAMFIPPPCIPDRPVFSVTPLPIDLPDTTVVWSPASSSSSSFPPKETMFSAAFRSWYSAMISLCFLRSSSARSWYCFFLMGSSSFQRLLTSRARSTRPIFPWTLRCARFALVGKKVLFMTVGTTESSSFWSSLLSSAFLSFDSFSSFLTASDFSPAEDVSSPFSSFAEDSLPSSSFLTFFLSSLALASMSFRMSSRCSEKKMLYALRARRGMSLAFFPFLRFLFPPLD
mmetsp:Transcript_63031/g.153529  ORF Transcript_63031/g.153529 Transcript_63031/m.153529 type:complete len:239 (+) Transcript_63031:540-1256(+)